MTYRNPLALSVFGTGILLFGQPATLTWNPDKIVWQRHDPDGTKYAVLDGDRDAPGEAHFEGSDGECVIIGTALGGWKTRELE